MAGTLFILDAAPCSSERAHDAWRLAGATAGRDGQRAPESCHDVERMPGKLPRRDSVARCGTRLDARGVQEAGTVDGAARSNLSELANRVLQADRVPVS